MNRKDIKKKLRRCREDTEGDIGKSKIKKVPLRNPFTFSSFPLIRYNQIDCYFKKTYILQKEISPSTVKLEKPTDDLQWETTSSMGCLPIKMFNLGMKSGE